MYSWHDIIQIMKGWIDEDIENIPRLSEMTARLGYSYFYAAKKFHEIEGISFREYIANRRINQAAADLYGTRERMIDVAIRYGYSSQEAFTRAFKKIYGITPGAYRKQKPAPFAEKSDLLGLVSAASPNQPNGGQSMKFYVKQMQDWNCYAYYAEDVEEQYWQYFKDELWWQAGNSFIKPYDNVKDFKYCAENFAKYGETAIKQQLKILPAPWEKALDLFIPEIEKTGVDWYVHGSAAMALWGIDVAPKDVNIIIPNYSDFYKVREHFYKMAITPFERCNNWVMSGLGNIFLEAWIGLAFHNKEHEPYDMGKLGKMVHNGKEIYISSLEMLRNDNDYFERPQRVALIEKRMGKK